MSTEELGDQLCYPSAFAGGPAATNEEVKACYSRLNNPRKKEGEADARSRCRPSGCNQPCILTGSKVDERALPQDVQLENEPSHVLSQTNSIEESEEATQRTEHYCGMPSLTDSQKKRRVSSPEQASVHQSRRKFVRRVATTGREASHLGSDMSEESIVREDEKSNVICEWATVLNSLQPGSVFAKKYRIKEVAGFKFNHVMFFAQNVYSRDEVVLKFYRNKSDFRESIEKHVMFVDSPFIVRCSDYVEESGYPPCLVLEKGYETLATWMKIKRHLNDKRTVLFQIMKALAYLHGIGKVHGYLSPSNIMLFGNDRWKLVDMDKVGNMNDLMPMTHCDIAYVAPETVIQGQQARLTPAQDMWSLGIISTELFLNGKRFYGSKSEASIRETLKSNMLIDNHSQVDEDEARRFATELLHINPCKRAPSTRAVGWSFFRNPEDETVIFSSGVIKHKHKREVLRDIRVISEHERISRLLKTRVKLEEIMSDGQDDLSNKRRSRKVSSIRPNGVKGKPTFRLNLGTDFEVKLELTCPEGNLAEHGKLQWVELKPKYEKSQNRKSIKVKPSADSNEVSIFVNGEKFAKDVSNDVSPRFGRISERLIEVEIQFALVTDKLGPEQPILFRETVYFKMSAMQKRVMLGRFLTGAVKKYRSRSPSG